MLDADDFLQRTPRRFDVRRDVEDVRTAVSEDEHELMWPVPEDPFHDGAGRLRESARGDAAEGHLHPFRIFGAAMNLDQPRSVTLPVDPLEFRLVACDRDVAPDLQRLPLERPFHQPVEVRGDDRLQLAVPDQLRQKEMIRVRLAEIEELEKAVQRGIPAQRFDERLEGQPRAHHHLNFFPRRACGREGAGNELAHQRQAGMDRKSGPAEDRGFTGSERCDEPFDRVINRHRTRHSSRPRSRCTNSCACVGRATSVRQTNPSTGHQAPESTLLPWPMRSKQTLSRGNCEVTTLPLCNHSSRKVLEHASNHV